MAVVLEFPSFVYLWLEGVGYVVNSGLMSDGENGGSFCIKGIYY